MPEVPLLARLVRDVEDRVRKTLESGADVVEKTIMLRKLAREIAKERADAINYRGIEEFKRDYELGRSPLIELEGPGIMYNDIVVLKRCTMASVMEDFMVDGRFPEHWSRLPSEYMKKFEKEAILHPLCILHQTFRDQLVSNIPKAEGVAHSLVIACRSEAGRIVYSRLGLSVAKISREKVEALVEGLACAFYVR